MLFMLLAAASLSAPQDTLVLSLEAATARALAQSPAVAAADGAVRAPRGFRAEAWWPFPDNPTLEYGRVRRTSAGGTSYDREWAVTQDVEIAGQWAWRGSGANALVRSAEARAVDVRRLTALDARRAYAALAIAERRAALTDSAAAFAEHLVDFAGRQFDAGEINRLELNAAVLEAARARSSADRALAEADGAAADLARLLGLPRDTVPRAQALPPVPALTWASDSVLVLIAQPRRADLRAAQEQRRGGDRLLTAARLSLVPTLTVSALGGREEGTDRLLGVALGLRIPLFHRQQAAIGVAAAERAVARAEETATTRAIQAEVLAAGARFRRARAAERRFATEVLRAATENVTLTERALAEGEVSVTDVLVLRGTAVSAQLEYLDVLRGAADAWFQLAAALAAEPAELPAVLGTEK